MFKFRKNKPSKLVVRTEDLQPGDQFVYDTGLFEVLDVHPGSETTRVRLGCPHPEFFVQTRQIELFNELLTSIVRP